MGLTGVWVVSLWFVIVLFAPAHKIHSDHAIPDSDPYGLVEVMISTDVLQVATKLTGKIRGAYFPRGEIGVH